MGNLLSTPPSPHAHILTHPPLTLTLTLTHLSLSHSPTSHSHTHPPLTLTLTHLSLSHSPTSHTHTHPPLTLTLTHLTGQDPPLSEWEFIPHIGPRPTRGFVGLKNAGATCYMNAVLQQVHTHTASAAIPAQLVAQPVAQLVKHRLRSLVVADLSPT